MGGVEGTEMLCGGKREKERGKGGGCGRDNLTGIPTLL